VQDGVRAVWSRYYYVKRGYGAIAFPRLYSIAGLTDLLGNLD
jgi:hypothetical protein